MLFIHSLILHRVNKVLPPGFPILDFQSSIRKIGELDPPESMDKLCNNVHRVCGHSRILTTFCLFYFVTSPEFVDRNSSISADEFTHYAKKKKSFGNDHDCFATDIGLIESTGEQEWDEEPSMIEAFLSLLFNNPLEIFENHNMVELGLWSFRCFHAKQLPDIHEGSCWLGWLHPHRLVYRRMNDVAILSRVYSSVLNPIPVTCCEIRNDLATGTENSVSVMCYKISSDKITEDKAREACDASK